MASLHLDEDCFALSCFQDISFKTIDIKYQNIKSEMPWLLTLLKCPIYFQCIYVMTYSSLH